MQYDFDEVEALKQQLTWDQLSAQLGIKAETLRKKHAAERDRRSIGLVEKSNASGKTISADVLTDMQRAAEQTQKQHTLTPWWSEDEINVGEIWKKHEEQAAQKIKKVYEQSRFNATLPTDRVSCITFISDQHIAPGTPCDFKRMREDAELVRDTRDVYAVLGGDAVDNHVRHFSAILSARSTPDDQYVLFEHYLQILKERLLVAISGNHDDWSRSVAGIDMLGWLSKQNKVAYSPSEARLYLKCGSQDYKVAVRHQYRLNSSFNQTHTVLQWLRLGEEAFDIGCIGHHHEAALSQTIYRGQMVWSCRPGSYQVSSQYSLQYGYNSSLPTCPSFLIFPDKRHIIGLADVRDVPKMLRVFNG